MPRRTDPSAPTRSRRYAGAVEAREQDDPADENFLSRDEAMRGDQLGVDGDVGVADPHTAAESAAPLLRQLAGDGFGKLQVPSRISFLGRYMRTA